MPVMHQSISQLRKAFGLSDSEELYGTFNCAHTRPSWTSHLYQGTLYVFSSCMVFQANLVAFIKVERICFKDVSVIRKRSFMRMPNTIAVIHAGRSGAPREDVFTSFLFASRKKAYELMLTRWAAANPAAAEAFLAGREPLAGGADCDGDGSGDEGSGGEGGAPAGPLVPFPAWTPVPLASMAQAAEGMTLVTARTLPGIDARGFAELLLADSSGFMPAAYKAAGNELTSLTAWQVASSASGQAQLQRTFKYVFSDNGPWGTIRSIVIQEQTLTVVEGDRLVLEVKQQMPDLPAGTGKCFYITMRWDISQLPGGTGGGGGTAAAVRERPVSPATPAGSPPQLAGEGGDTPSCDTLPRTSADAACAGAASPLAPGSPVTAAPRSASAASAVRQASGPASGASTASCPPELGLLCSVTHPAGQPLAAPGAGAPASSLAAVAEPGSPGGSTAGSSASGAAFSAAGRWSSGALGGDALDDVVKGLKHGITSARAGLKGLRRGSKTSSSAPVALSAAHIKRVTITAVQRQGKPGGSAAVAEPADETSPVAPRAASDSAAMEPARAGGAASDADAADSDADASGASPRSADAGTSSLSRAASGPARSEGLASVPEAGNNADGAGDGCGGVRLELRLGVTFVKWHVAQAKIERDTLATTGAALEQVVAAAVEWCGSEEARTPLADVMPQAAVLRRGRKGRKHRRGSGGSGAGAGDACDEEGGARGGAGFLAGLLASWLSALSELGAEAWAGLSLQALLLLALVAVLLGQLTLMGRVVELQARMAAILEATNGGQCGGGNSGA